MSKDKTVRTRFNLFLDAGLAVAFVIALKPFVTGLAFHEWLGLGIGAALVLHAVAHRQWIVGITRQLFRKLPVRTRVYYAVDATLLLTFAVIIITGVMMSTAVLPLFGVQGIDSLTVALVHKWASYLTLVLLGIKLGLHWTWLKNAVRRHVVGASQPVQGSTLRSPALAPVPATSGHTVKTLSRRRFLLIGCSAAGVALLAIIHKTRQTPGDPLTTSTEVPSGDAALTVIDVPVDTASATVAAVESVNPTAVTEGVEPTAIPTATPVPAVAPRRTATRCPRGMVNDPYPGRCRHYVDKNGDGLCDLSETA